MPQLITTSTRKDILAHGADLATYAGLKETGKMRYGYPIWICPWCGAHTLMRAKGSSDDKFIFLCGSRDCGQYGDIGNIYAKIHNLDNDTDFVKIFSALAQGLGINPDDKTHKYHKLENRNYIRESHIFEINLLNDVKKWVKQAEDTRFLRRMHDWRGISRATLKAHLCGYEPYFLSPDQIRYFETHGIYDIYQRRWASIARMITPCVDFGEYTRDAGGVYHCQTMALYPDDIPFKYRNLVKYNIGLNRMLNSQLLYTPDRLAKQGNKIAVVESVTDALSVYEVSGHYAIALTGVGMAGLGDPRDRSKHSLLSWLERKPIPDDVELIIALDYDEAGVEASNGLCARLNAMGIRYKQTYFGGVQGDKAYKDANEVLVHDRDWLARAVAAAWK